MAENTDIHQLTRAFYRMALAGREDEADAPPFKMVPEDVVDDLRELTQKIVDKVEEYLPPPRPRPFQGAVFEIEIVEGASGEFLYQISAHHTSGASSTVTDEDITVGMTRAYGNVVAASQEETPRCPALGYRGYQCVLAGGHEGEHVTGDKARDSVATDELTQRREVVLEDGRVGFIKQDRGEVVLRGDVRGERRLDRYSSDVYAAYRVTPDSEHVWAVNERTGINKRHSASAWVRMSLVGETPRIDPSSGNGYLLGWGDPERDKIVYITDIFGNHGSWISTDVWKSWPLADENNNDKE